MDEKLHLVGIGEIDSYGNVNSESELPTKVSFSGITLDIKVPRVLALDERGVRRFAEGEKVRIDCLVQEQNYSKSFNQSSYVAKAFTVKKVLAFEKVKG